MTSTIKSFNLSSSLKDEAMVTNMQGIVSILATDSEILKISSNSLRRTLSADMSSRTWLSQQGFSPLKKVVSLENFSVSIAEYSLSSSSSSSLFDAEEEDYDNDHCSNKNENNNHSLRLRIRVSLISGAQSYNKRNWKTPTTFLMFDPLVRRSSCSLCEKSLQTCTESLGSETGSDGFSSYTPSETSDGEEEKEEQSQQQQRQQEVLNINDYDVNYKNPAAATKRATPKSFPPISYKIFVPCG